MKNFKLLVIAVLSFSMMNSVFSLESKVSEEKIDMIQKIIHSYQKAGEDLHDEDVKEAIMKDISKLGPLSPSKKAKTKTTKELYKKVKSMIDKRFPKKAKTVVKTAQREADRKFKLVKPLTYVTVLYERGDRIYKVSGVFYSYGGNSIKIDEKNVAIFDLLPEYRAKFDRTYCEKKKKEFINGKLQEYFQVKNNFSTTKVKELKKKQQKYNENAGYIYAWKDWRTPKEITEIYIQTIADGVKLSKKSDLNKTLAQSTNKKVKKKDSDTEEDNGDMTQPEEVAKKPIVEKTEEEIEYEKLVKKANEALQKIGQTYAGIDADQGFKKAIWGMSRKDVSILLKGAIPAESTNEVSTINYPKGIIKSVHLYFFHGFFYKVVIDFRIGPSRAMKELALRLNERYGRSNEEKEALKKQAEADAAEKAAKEKEKNKKGKKGKKGKKKKTPPPPPKKLEQVFHWTGEITQAVLYIKVKDDHSGYETFTLTKENPKIKKDVALHLEREALKKKQKQRQKELQQFKDIKKVDF